jgi:ATP-binding cassette subfamily B protein
LTYWLAGTVLTRTLKRGLDQVPHLPRAFLLVFQASPSTTTLWVALLIVQGVLPVATVYLTRAVVDHLAAALQVGNGRLLAQTLGLALAYSAVALVLEIAGAAGRWVRVAQAERIRDHLAGLVHERSTTVDLAFYESSEFYDRLHRARDESGDRSIALFESLGGVTQTSITLVAMVGVLLPLGPWIALALVATTLPAVAVVVRYAVREHHWWLEHTEEQRRTWYLDWLLTGPEAAAELRLFKLGNRFRADYQSLRDHLREERLALSRDRSVAEGRATAIALIVGGGAALWMIRQAILGVFTLGDLALAYQAFQLGQGLMRTLVGNVGQIYSNSLFLGSLFEFLSLRPRIIDPPSPTTAPTTLARDMRFERVTFTYPGAERAALRAFDLELPAGQVTAVVGTNGAGKSTLVKLACRFYDPDEGRITIDGDDLRSFAVEELRSRISAIFQQPMRYNATAAENVALGDNAAHTEHTRIEAAVEAAAARGLIEGLPRGYDTLLGSWFAGGRELSVGEWQRIALARALLRPAPILLLDEPTSAMDSWAETEWIARLRSVAKDRTVLIITHRFTTAMRADVIYVMEEGKIVEQGSHDELVRRGGRYAESWKKQNDPRSL